MGYVVPLGGREGNDCLQLRPQGVQACTVHCSAPNWQPELLVGPSEGGTSLGGWCLTRVQHQRPGVAAGAVPGFSGVGGTQAAGISSCKYLRGENVQGVHGSLCWLLASTVMKPDVFSPELVSIKSNHSHCVSNNSPCFSFLILAGSG